MQIFLVGGSVRDELLNLPVNDKDWVVVGATPQEMLEQGYLKVGKDFPVFLHPDTKEEYALARTERKIGKGYHGFECYSATDVTIEQDLMRRDLTINAIAKSEKGDLIDPFNGQTDINNRVLRHVSEAFSEDPVRILRVARFAARYAHLGFTIADETLKLMQEMVANGEVDALVPERVWKEMSSALLEASPEVFFESLRQCGALAKLFPDLDKLWGIPQPERYHPEIDTGVHVMMSLKKSVEYSDKLSVRFAVLCHDLGKGKTPKSKWPSHHGHEGLGVKPISNWCKQYRVPNDCKDLAVKVAKWHLHAHKALELTPKTLLKFLSALDAFRKPELLEDFLLACMADTRGRKGLEEQAYPQADYIREVFQIVQAVDVKALMAKGYEGGALGEQLYRARLQAIKIFKDQQN